MRSLDTDRCEISFAPCISLCIATIGLHVCQSIEAGKIAVSEGAQNATSFGFYLNFYGKSVHAARRELGIDKFIKIA